MTRQTTDRQLIQVLIWSKFRNPVTEPSGSHTAGDTKLGPGYRSAIKSTEGAILSRYNSISGARRRSNCRRIDGNRSFRPERDTEGSLAWRLGSAGKQDRWRAAETRE